MNQASCFAVVEHLEGYKVNELSFLTCLVGGE